MTSGGGLLNLIAVGSNNIFLMDDGINNNGINNNGINNNEINDNKDQKKYIGNPSAKLFKTTYMKHRNFGLQKFRIDYNGLRELRLNEPSIFKFKFPRNAELIMDTYLVITLPDIWSPIYHPCEETNFTWSAYDFRWIKDIGLQIIQDIEITAGSITLQRYTGAYLSAVIQRDFSAVKKELYNKMSGNIPELNDPANAFGRFNEYPSSYYTPHIIGAEPSIRGRNLYIPLNLWFSLLSSSAFPLTCLQYNELFINITLRPIQEIFQIRDVFDQANNHPYIQPDFTQQQNQLYRFLQTPPSVNIDSSYYENTISSWNADVHLMATYCFLSKEENTELVSQRQDYLMKDVYTYLFENVAGANKVKLQSSNGMVSNWIFYFQRNDVNLRNEWSNYTNWAYDNLPANTVNAPQTDYNSPFSSTTQNNIGPFINEDDSNTGFFITGDYNVDNIKDILQTLGIVLDGCYRENVMERGVYDYIEKYTRTAGSAPEGIYVYNFALDSNPLNYQPTGAINMSKFRNIEFEFTTYLPAIDTTNSQVNIVCDNAGNPIGVLKQNWRLYNYNFNLIIHEEKYNVLTFINGECGVLFAR